MFIATLWSGTIPTALRSSGMKPIPSREAWRGVRTRAGRPRTSMWPRSGSAPPTMRTSVGGARAEQAGEPEDLALLDLDADRLRPSATCTSRRFSTVAASVGRRRALRSAVCLRPRIMSARRSSLSPARGTAPTRRPSRSTVTWSQMRSTSSRRWLTKSRPTPRSRRRPSSSSTLWDAEGSSEAVGSSRIRNWGQSSIARAISTNLRSAGPSVRTSASGSRSMPSRPSVSRTSLRILGLSTMSGNQLRRGGALPTPKTLSMTLRSGNRW